VRDSEGVPPVAKKVNGREDGVTREMTRATATLARSSEWVIGRPLRSRNGRRIELPDMLCIKKNIKGAYPTQSARGI